MLTRRIKKSAYIIMFCLVLLSGCALSRDVIYLDDRIDVIEQKISKQSSSASGNIKSLRKEYAVINNRFQRLSDQIRQVEGRFEETEYALDRQKTISTGLKADIERLDMIVAELTNRMNHLEIYTGYDSSDVKPPAGVVGKKPLPVPIATVPEDLKLYESAKQMLDNNDLKGAREGFRNLIKQFPKSKNADNAQFWIGESFYREKWYQKAILEYQKVIENYPRGNKVAGAYLKQGLAFAELGEKDNSRLILNELLKKFPNSGEAVIARKKLNKPK